MKPRHQRRYNGKPVVELHSVAEEIPFLELVRAPNGLALIRYDAATGALECITDFPWNDQVVLPPEEDEFTRHIIIPTRISLQRYLSPRSLLEEIEGFLDACLEVEERHRFLLACFVLSTWLIDALRVAPYIAFVGLPQSGKSTALKSLQLICRRGMITSDISSAAFYRACERFRPTLFIDEAATASQQKALFHLLRTGSTRDSVVFRAGESYCTFGAKVMSFRELPDDDALNSRCVVIPMRESFRTTRRPTDRRMLDHATSLRAKLLRYRFEHLPPSRRIPGIRRLRSRNRDLYESLVYPIGNDLELGTRLLNYFIDAQQSTREPLLPREMAVVETLFEQIHLHPDQANYALKQLTQEMNVTLSKSGERLRLNPRAAGALLHTLGFRDRNRTSAGFVVCLDRPSLARIHDLMWTYGLDAPSAHLSGRAESSPCEFCKAGPSRRRDGFREEEARFDDDDEDEEYEDNPNQPLTWEDVLDDEALRELRIGKYAGPFRKADLARDAREQSPPLEPQPRSEETGSAGNGSPSAEATPANGRNAADAKQPASQKPLTNVKPSEGTQGESSGTRETSAPLTPGSRQMPQNDVASEIGPGYRRGWIENAADQKHVDELRHGLLQGMYPSDRDASTAEEGGEDKEEDEDEDKGYDEESGSDDLD